MAYNSNSAIMVMIREDLAKTEGHREGVKVNALERLMVKKVSPSELHVNPDDEFTHPEVGPNEAIVENYSQIARRDTEMSNLVYKEPIIVYKLRVGGYMMLNGHHRWAGAIRACVPKVRIQITNTEHTG